MNKLGQKIQLWLESKRELEKIIQFLLENGVPIETINKIIYKQKQKK